jgi:hypothetical protein
MCEFYMNSSGGRWLLFFFCFLRIIFDVDAQFHALFFLSKDNEELFAAESRLLHGY